MTRTWLAALGSLLVLPALAGCPPELTGAPCNHSTDCPNQQICIGGHCGYSSGTGGTTGGTSTSGGTSGGSGGNQRIDGTLALNSRFPKPQSNAAWVLLWDHFPVNVSGSVDTPQTLTTVDGEGSFRFEGLVNGKSYYLMAQYDIDADGNQVDPGTAKADVYWYRSETATPGSSIEIDVPTSGCLVASLTDSTGTSYLSELIASVRSVTDGTEITNATVSATGPGTNPMTLPLTYQNGTPRPEINNAYSWIPDGGGLTSPIRAVGGTYRFDISTPKDQGYGTGSCTIEHHPLNSAPSGMTFTPSGAIGGFPTTVSWTSAPLTKEDDIYFQVKGLDLGTQSVITVPCYQANSVSSPFGIPSACSRAMTNFMVTSLEVQVVSIRFVNNPLVTPQGVSVEGGILSGSQPICSGC